MFKINLGICVNGIMEMRILKLVTPITLFNVFMTFTNFQFPGGQTLIKKIIQRKTELGTLE